MDDTKRQAFEFARSVDTPTDGTKTTALLKEYAKASGAHYAAVRSEYDAWCKAREIAGEAPCLVECGERRDFFSARVYAALMRGGGLYDFETISEREKDAGLTCGGAEENRRATDFANQFFAWREVAETRCGGYTLALSGVDVLAAKPTKQNPDGSPVLVASAFIYRGRARDYEDSAWHHIVEFKTAGGVWKTKTFPSASFGGRSEEWVAECRAEGATIAEPGILAKLIWASPAPDLKRIAAKPGWQDEKHTCYVTKGGEVIGGDAETIPTFKRAEGYGRKGTKEEADRLIFDKCVGNSRAMTAVTAAFAAPLLDPMGVHPGMINFCGDSGFGKSAVLRMGLATEANGDKLESWLGTGNGVGVQTARSNDCMSALDEGKLMTAHGVFMTVMSIGNGRGKVALNKDRTLKEVDQFTTLALSSMETDVRSFLESQKDNRAPYDGGIASRCADVPIDTGKHRGFEELHGAADGEAFVKGIEDAVKSHYGHHTPAFVKAFIADPKGRERIHQLMDEAAKVITISGDDNVSRVVDRFCLMAAAGEYAAENGIVNWPVGSALAGVKIAADAWYKARVGDGGKAGATTALVGIQRLENALAMEGARFQRYTGDQGVSQVPQRCLGFIVGCDNGGKTLFLSKDQLTEIVGAERVEPVLKYIGDSRHQRFTLKRSGDRRLVHPPREHGIREALGDWCIGIGIGGEARVDRRVVRRLHGLFRVRPFGPMVKHALPSSRRVAGSSAAVH